MLDIIFNLNEYLEALVQTYGVWIYAIMFVVIFCETGLVVTPFLPGDSLLFSGGAIAAAGSLSPVLLTVLLFCAAVLGDTVNYWIGSFVGPRGLKKEHLTRTQEFYEKYGKAAIILARFFPILRTFAPLLAGVGKMNYWNFAAYNISGGLIWVSLFVWAGFLFGNVPFVKENFSIVIAGIILLSFLPGAVNFAQRRMRRHRN